MKTNDLSIIKNSLNTLTQDLGLCIHDPALSLKKLAEELSQKFASKNFYAKDKKSNSTHEKNIDKILNNTEELLITDYYRFRQASNKYYNQTNNKQAQGACDTTNLNFQEHLLPILSHYIDKEHTTKLRLKTTLSLYDEVAKLKSQADCDENELILISITNWKNEAALVIRKESLQTHLTHCISEANRRISQEKTTAEKIYASAQVMSGQLLKFISQEDKNNALELKSKTEVFIAEKTRLTTQLQEHCNTNYDFFAKRKLKIGADSKATMFEIVRKQEELEKKLAEAEGKHVNTLKQLAILEIDLKKVIIDISDNQKGLSAMETRHYEENMADTECFLRAQVPKNCDVCKGSEFHPVRRSVQLVDQLTRHFAKRKLISLLSKGSKLENDISKQKLLRDVVDAEFKSLEQQILSLRILHDQLQQLSANLLTISLSENTTELADSCGRLQQLDQQLQTSIRQLLQLDLGIGLQIELMNYPKYGCVIKNRELLQGLEEQYQKWQAKLEKISESLQRDKLELKQATEQVSMLFKNEQFSLTPQHIELINQQIALLLKLQSQYIIEIETKEKPETKKITTEFTQQTLAMISPQYEIFYKYWQTFNDWMGQLTAANKITIGEIEASLGSIVNENPIFASKQQSVFSSSIPLLGTGSLKEKARQLNESTLNSASSAAASSSAASSSSSLVSSTIQLSSTESKSKGDSCEAKLEDDDSWVYVSRTNVNPSSTNINSTANNLSRITSSTKQADRVDTSRSPAPVAPTGSINGDKQVKRWF